MEQYSIRYAFYKLNLFLSFYSFPRKATETFYTQHGATQGHCHAGPNATLALTGLGVAALAATVTDRWGQAVSVKKKKRDAFASAGNRTRDARECGTAWCHWAAAVDVLDYVREPI